MKQQDLRTVTLAKLLFFFKAIALLHSVSCNATLTCQKVRRSLASLHTNLFVLLRPFPSLMSYVRKRHNTYP